MRSLPRGARATTMVLSCPRQLGPERSSATTAASECDSGPIRRPTVVVVTSRAGQRNDSAAVRVAILARVSAQWNQMRAAA